MSDLLNRGIIRLTHSKTGETRYFGWSGPCDAPSTHGMTLDELTEQIMREARMPEYRLADAGPEERVEIEAEVAYRLAKVERKLARLAKRGTSFLDDEDPGEKYIKGNRAGENEKELTANQIIERYR